MSIPFVQILPEGSLFAQILGTNEIPADGPDIPGYEARVQEVLDNGGKFVIRVVNDDGTDATDRNKGHFRMEIRHGEHTASSRDLAQGDEAKEDVIVSNVKGLIDGALEHFSNEQAQAAEDVNASEGRLND